MNPEDGGRLTRGTRLTVESGFEIIKCDFHDSLELVATNQRLLPSETGGGEDERTRMLEYMRAVSQRYDGIGSSRVALDYSSMVSALFYPVNLTNPDPKMAELPRLISNTDAEMHAIKMRVTEVVRDRVDGSRPSIDWQGVVDMVVARYADNLKNMAERVDTIESMRRTVNHLLDTVIDYAEDDPEFSKAKARCTHQYLYTISPATQEDALIFAAVERVTSSICSTLFHVRRLVVESEQVDESSLSAASDSLRSLIDKLRWTRWTRCPQCDYDEVCYTAMYPWGDRASHRQPGCRNATSLGGYDNYWFQCRWRSEDHKWAN